VSSTTNFLQGNGYVKFTNKDLGILLTKLINGNRIDWDEHLLTVLFSYKITYKVTTRYTPYQLMYELHPLMFIEYIMPIVSGNHRDNTSMRVLINRISKLEKLQEARMKDTKITGI